MANQQIYPQSTYPGAGDISTSPGSPLTTVDGWQNTPIAPGPPTNMQGYLYTQTGSEYQLYTLEGIWINGGFSGSGATKQVFINGVTDGSHPSWTVFINGAADGG